MEIDAKNIIPRILSQLSDKVLQVAILEEKIAIMNEQIISMKNGVARCEETPHMES